MRAKIVIERRLTHGAKGKTNGTLEVEAKGFHLRWGRNTLAIFVIQQIKQRKTSGSRVVFISKEHPTIFMHRPHVRKELLEYQVKQLIEILEQEGLL